MKLIVVIAQNDDADTLTDVLTHAEFRATRLASTGGFLRQGNTTIILGVENEQVDRVLALIGSVSQVERPEPRRNNGKNQQSVQSTAEALLTAATLDPGARQQAGRATVFVLNLERYEHV